jgi:hypothetical protein
VGNDERRPLPKDQVPFLGVIMAAGPLSKTAESFLRWEAKEAELRQIDAELGQLRQERPSMDELRENVRQSYDRYYQRTVSRMVKFIGGGAVNPDYFVRLERAAVDRGLVLVPWSLVEDALVALESGGYTGLPADEKKKEIASLEKKRSKIEPEMEALLPSAQFAKNDPQSNAAICAASAFFDHWRSLQVYTVDPCCYQGKALHLAADETQKAHAVLNLSALRSRSAKVSAYTPPATVA